MPNFTPAVNRIVVNSGERYNRFTIIKEIDSRRIGKVKHRVFLCLCDCGTEKSVILGRLRSNHTQSCGCITAERARPTRLTPKRRVTFDPSHKRENHGESWTGNRLYNIWAKMRHRCGFEDDPAYENYGARGISVCPEWNSYTVFRKWAMENGYADNLTIDRKDNNGNYEPCNCWWTTMLVQSRNTRANRYITAFGETKIITDWLLDPRCKTSWPTLHKRLSRGVCPEDAISKGPRELRMTMVTPERRQQIGRNAAAARWGTKIVEI